MRTMYEDLWIQGVLLARRQVGAKDAHRLRCSQHTLAGTEKWIFTLDPEHQKNRKPSWP